MYSSSSPSLPTSVVLVLTGRNIDSNRLDVLKREWADFQLKKLLVKYRHQEKIKYRSLKCLFTGPPRVGKTTLKKRLLKIIKNIISSGEVSPSGGLEKPISVVIGDTREPVTVVLRSGTDWQPQRDLLDEAQRALEFVDNQPTTQDPGATTISSPTPPLEPGSVPPTPGSPTPDSPIDPPTPGEADTFDNVKLLMQQVLASRKVNTIKDIEKTTTLYLMDTGGQPEFHEIMSIILNGPALHLVFFNLSDDLNDPITIQFCQCDGTDAMITYNSSYTGKQMIYQLLSSLYDMYLNKDFSPHSEQATVQGLLPNSEPAAVLIGTHLDQLKDHEGERKTKMEEINNTLEELLSNAEFHKHGFLTYPKTDKKGTIFIPVNNYDGSAEEIQKLQVFLKQVIVDRFSPVELPSSWLWFHLILRHRYEKSQGVCKLAECQALAKGCGLDKDDVPQVLWYIHRHLGTILFYDQVQGLNELVICDPNVLFKSIYQLVAVSFGGDKGYHTSAADIRKTGEIPSKVLERIVSQPSGSPLTNKHIIELLKHFKILTEFVSDGRTVYFMPCLLQPNNSLEVSCETLQALYPPPLLVCFNGNYIPIGVFSGLVVELSQSSWEPDRDKRYRNQILFHTNGVFPVELIVHPTYLEFRLRIVKKEELNKIHQFCMEVRKTVVDGLKSVFGLHEHTKKVKFHLGFYCPGSFHGDSQPHFCRCLPRLNYINPESYLCSKSPRCQDQSGLTRECTIWFEYWKVCCSLLSISVCYSCMYLLIIYSYM